MLLEDKLEMAKSYAAQKGMVLFNGWWVPVDNYGARFVWSRRNKDFKSFIDVAVALGVKVLMYDLRFLEEYQLTSLMEDIEELEDDVEVEELRTSLDSLRLHSGEASEITLAFKHGDEIYIYNEQTEWAKTLDELTEEVDGLLEDQDSE
jgi:hypothetical protein